MIEQLETRDRGADRTRLELFLLGRACSSACVLAVRLHPTLTPIEIADLLSRREGFDGFRAAFAEDCLVTLTKGREVDPTRLIRADTHDLIAGFMCVIAGLATMCADRLDASPRHVVVACFHVTEPS